MRKFTWDIALFFKLFACLINVSFEGDVELYDFNFQETQEQVPDIILANKKKKYTDSETKLQRIAQLVHVLAEKTSQCEYLTLLCLKLKVNVT